MQVNYSAFSIYQPAVLDMHAREFIIKYLKVMIIRKDTLLNNNAQPNKPKTFLNLLNKFFVREEIICM